MEQSLLNRNYPEPKPFNLKSYRKTNIIQRPHNNEVANTLSTSNEIERKILMCELRSYNMCENKIYNHY